MHNNTIKKKTQILEEAKINPVNNACIWIVGEPGWSDIVLEGKLIYSRAVVGTVLQ